MIFDGHAYCFPSLFGAAGFDDAETLSRQLQHAMATHHQPAWRVRDGAPSDFSALIEEVPRPLLDHLKKSDFRAAPNGRFEWTADGEVHAKQYFPPSVADMSYPADRLVAEMDYAGVDRALLHRTPYLGVGNDFVAECVRSFPDRLFGLAHVQEWTIQSDPEAAARKIEVAVRELGLSGLHFLPPQLDLYGQTGPWDAPAFLPFWDAVAGLGIPVFLSVKDREEPRLESYVDELGTLMRWMERYPDVKVVHTHGFPWRLFIDGDAIRLPEVVWKPFDNPNLFLQLLFPITLGNIWDYPMPQARPVIEGCAKRIGPSRLMWGTDMPIVMRHWTYRQNIDVIRRYCDFLGPDDMGLVMGGTVSDLMGAGPLENPARDRQPGLS